MMRLAHYDKIESTNHDADALVLKYVDTYWQPSNYFCKNCIIDVDWLLWM